MSWLFRFYQELKRRNVIKSVISYLVVAWVLLQVTALLSDLLNAPQYIGQGLLVVLLILLPIWIGISWYYEITPEGLKKTVTIPREKSITKKTGQRLNKVIITFLTIALVILVVDRFVITKKINSQTMANYSPPVQTQSIAVLPFSDFSPEKDHGYFADGLTEELLNLLTTIHKLKVTSRTSSFSFKNSKLPISEIANTLKVNYILEGSVRKAEDQLRITAQLIDVATDKHVWSKTFDKKFENILSIQDEVAQEVVNSLHLKFLGELPRTVKTNPEAYALYLKAKHSFKLRGEQDLLDAIEALQRAIAIDSSYSPAKILLAEVYQEQVNYGLIDFKQGTDKVIATIDPVIAKEPNNAVALAFRGDIAMANEWDFKKANTYLEKALALAPTNAEVISYAAMFQLSNGNFEQAAKLYEYAITLDPLNDHAHYGLGLTYYSAGRLSLAEKSLRNTIAIDPQNWAGYFYLSKTLMLQGRIEEALKTLEHDTDVVWRLVGYAAIYFKSGDLNKADSYLNELKEHEEMAYQIAQIHAFRKEEDLAFQWLEKAYSIRDLGLNEILSEPDFKYLHKLPRWDRFIEKLGFYK